MIERDLPFSPISLSEKSQCRYDISWGNFALDLNQRGNAPRGVGIWFDYQGQQFWLPEASANYREALYLLAEHVELRYDPTLCRWGRRWFWGKWRDCRKRADLQNVMAEIHRILAREQLRPEVAVIAETPVVAVIHTPPEPTPESLANNEDAQRPVGECIAIPTIDHLHLEGATLRLNNGKATLIVSAPAKRGGK